MLHTHHDDTLSLEAQYILGMLEDPLTADEISFEMNISLHKIRSYIHELMEQKLIKCIGDKYQLDTLGTKKLLELSNAV